MQMLQIEAKRSRTLIAVMACVVALIGGCAGESAPEVPGAADGTADPVLVEGRTLWQANCARCHGGAGGGGAGPALQGPWPEDRHPDAATMAAVIHSGMGAMPRFGNSLSDAEIDAIVRYIREVL